jgi:hypothetical protein
MISKYCVGAIALGLLLPAVGAQVDDATRIQAVCRDHSRGQQANIRACLSLVQEGKVSRPYFSSVYREVAFTFYELGDVVQAIAFTHKEIEILLENMKSQLGSRNLSPMAREALPKVVSYGYQRLGQYYALARLKDTRQGSAEARQYARDELQSYNSAVLFDASNHAAIMARAGIQSQFCEAAAAEMDKARATKIAESTGDERSFREYRSAFLPTCEPTWRAK